MSKIKPMPCPFCGNEEPDLMEKPVGTDRKVWKHYLSCDVCFALGPRAFATRECDKKAAEDAITLWNDRRHA